MSDEFDHSTEPTFSAFWPMLILLCAFLVWLGCEDFSLNTQRSQMSKNLQAAMPTYGEAQNISTRYIALMKDLVQTAQKDEAAKTIVNDAIKAGLIHVQPNANGTNAAPAAPAEIAK